MMILRNSRGGRCFSGDPTAQDSVSCNLVSQMMDHGTLTVEWRKLKLHLSVGCECRQSDNRSSTNFIRAGTYTVTVIGSEFHDDWTTVTVEEPDVLVANTTAQDSGVVMDLQMDQQVSRNSWW